MSWALNTKKIDRFYHNRLSSWFSLAPISFTSMLSSLWFVNSAPEHVFSAKCLSNFYDCVLHFDLHARDIVKKSVNFVPFIKRGRDILTKKCITMIYHSILDVESAYEEALTKWSLNLSQSYRNTCFVQWKVRTWEHQQATCSILWFFCMWNKCLTMSSEHLSFDYRKIYCQINSYIVHLIEQHMRRNCTFTKSTIPRHQQHHEIEDNARIRAGFGFEVTVSKE